MPRLTAPTGGLAAMLLMLAGCGGADHNEADVEFASSMIEHHAQAIQMANFTIGRDGLDPRIAELAEEIRLSQTEEIDTMAGYLRDWGEEVPETGFATGDSHSHEDDMSAGEHADMPGMMTSSEMEKLAGAQPAEFADLWMSMMAEHHEGAVQMVDVLQEDGQHDGLRELADAIEKAQRAEIEDLERWLASESR